MLTVCGELYSALSFVLLKKNTKKKNTAGETANKTTEILIK